ncbi:syntaxin-binding protein 5-like isoform X2 [Macrosteles quadrilineatus]|uniref:syntaxin-binding protein 5-like isoform X2 n=1 Tax=Macrosteles quadrilineatus TaxID=74068 RepID=UPI0023E0F9BE|nr:syntaxin-binding protein 5-like isoform X2 [Macrosteles quadrilineatus]XP_054272382.1 syntaxin-binding protein 5-like isoform X2 [Macrosteles quadrilineatus]
MKKFTFQRVLDGLRSSVSQQPRPEQEIVETLRPDNFQVTKTFRHGFPYQPTAVAFDPVQHLLAIGTKTGSLRLLGRPGVDSHVRHETDAAVVQIVFLMNEGALVTATADDSLHLWNFRQKRPEVVHSLKFQRERITFMHLPLQSKWLYVGSERGNIHVVNIESFVLSGYVINWNKAIEVCRKTHPGPVIHLSDNPLDPSKLLIGYESGQLVLWDLRTRTAELRWHSAEPLKSVTWHHEGKQFMCSHTDGSLTTWNVRASPKPLNVSFPHAKTNKDGKLETCKPIQKVEWKSSRSGEAYVIFSGGLTYDKAGRTPSITVIHGKTTTVLEMEHNVVDFITLCESPWVSDMQEPYAIVVLLHNDLVVIDLLSQGFPCFENPYPMDLHESAVTCCTYLADCPSDLIPAFYSVGSRTQKRTGFSEREWPISGGEWSPTSCSYNEIILTGHADGSIKFWDASAGTLQVLYKLKTSKVFEKPRTKSVDGSAEEDPFAIQLISLCPESRKLCIAGASSYVILFKFRKLESVGDTCTLEIPVVYEVSEEPEVSPECEYPPKPSLTDPDNKKSSLEYTLPVKVKPGPIKKPPGFQAHLVCITPVANGDSPSSITALCINSSYGLMAYGNEVGLVVVDIVQKCCLLSIGTPDLYGNADPYQRVPRSPKRNPLCEGDGERCRSPSIDQVIDYEELDRLVISPGLYSAQVSPNPDTDVETAEDAFCLDEADHPSKDRRSSSSWKGFSLKKQLSRVDMKLKHTFSAPPEKTGKRNSVFYSGSNAVSPAENSGSNSPEYPNSPEPESEDLPSIVLIKEAESEDVVEGGSAVRPTELQLFDHQGKPIRPPRKDRKRVSVDQKTPNRSDTRLLSVPNIKYSNQQGLRDLRRKEAMKLSNHNNQAFGNIKRKINKLDSSFSRSRSSSMSSLENISSEAIQCLSFADSYTKKSASTFPTLWVGTSLGSVLTVMLNVPAPGETRLSQPVAVSPCGTIFRLKGCILTMSFLDCNGALIPYSYESWKDEGKQNVLGTPTRSSTNNSRMSPPLGGSEMTCDRQFVVLVSEKQARVVALPSQNCVYRQQLADTDFVVKAEIISLKDSVCLVCYISSGHITAYSLPSLRPLIDVDFLPLPDLSFQTRKQGIVDPMLSIWGQQMFVNEDTDQIARTFCFSNRGHGLFLSSPSEVQKFTVSAEFCSSLVEMVGELFLPHDMPEPPKQSFFQGLFGGGSRNLDREELFGESSGRASRSVAKHIPGPSAQIQELNQRATSASSEVSRAHQLMVERGAKLGQLEERTERMMGEAENFQTSAHSLMLKYKDKKWYQL